MSQISIEEIKQAKEYASRGANANPSLSGTDFGPRELGFMKYANVLTHDPSNQEAKTVCLKYVDDFYELQQKDGGKGNPLFQIWQVILSLFGLDRETMHNEALTKASKGELMESDKKEMLFADMLSDNVGIKYDEINKIENVTEKEKAKTQC